VAAAETSGGHHQPAHRASAGVGRKQPARVLLAAVLALLLAAAAAGGAALVSGRVKVITTHGISMNPVYYQGDLVIVAKARSYHVGEIVAYRAPGQPAVILHRIIGGNRAGFVMKGDNNDSIDPHHPTAPQILGHAIAHIPRGGKWLTLITSPAATAFIAFLLVTSGGAGTAAARHRTTGAPRTLLLGHGPSRASIRRR
jgi:signal peptidase I